MVIGGVGAGSHTPGSCSGVVVDNPRLFSNNESLSSFRSEVAYIPVARVAVQESLSKNFVGHGWPERSAHGCARSGFWKGFPALPFPQSWQARARSLTKSPEARDNNQEARNNKKAR